MTKIEEILEKYKSKTDHHADQDWYDENVEKAMIEYAEYCVSKERYLLKQQILDLAIELSVSEKITEELQKLLKDD